MNDCKALSHIMSCIEPLNGSPDYIRLVEINYLPASPYLESYERLIHLDPAKIEHIKLGNVIRTLLRDRKYSTDIIVKYSNK